MLQYTLNTNALRCLAMLILFLCIFTEGNMAMAKDKASPCDGRQWKSIGEELACRFPPPPIGRWKAVYTADFAKTHNLPPENISTDLSPGVDYMEMDVQPYNKNAGTACIVNMLIKRPNDIAVYNKGNELSWEKEFQEHRHLAHFIDLDDHKEKLKVITTFGLAPRNTVYSPQKSYSIGSSFAFHAENILEGYDYIAANADCYHILSNSALFPNGWAFTYAKATLWGRHQPLYSGPDSVGRPKDKVFFDSLVFINIHPELISFVFKDMPVGGR